MIVYCNECKTPYCDYCDDNCPECPREIFVCDNCASEWKEDELDEVENLGLRLAPGDTVPWGQCPIKECGAFCYKQ
jgi:uncharacterized Zn ribbon protein